MSYKKRNLNRIKEIHNDVFSQLCRFHHENRLYMLYVTHRPTLCTKSSPYCNCGSCVHPRCITCLEICGFDIQLVKWCESTEKSGHFGNIYALCPPSFPVYIKREVLSTGSLISE